MKIVVAIMQHETNTFSNIATPLYSFAQPLGYEIPPAGDQAIKWFKGTKTAIGAYIDLIDEFSHDCIVPLAAYAEPSAAVENDAFEYMVTQICDCVSEGCDGIMLDLHGAMVTQDLYDGEGELLRRIRNVNPTVPIAVVLDFHANLSDDICNLANIVVGYRTYPHIDIYECGLRAGTLLLQTLDGQISPRTIWGSAPMLTHMIVQTPSKEPMKSIMDYAIECEISEKVLSASVFGGFPLADIPQARLSVTVIVNDDEPENIVIGKQLISQLLAMAWDRRVQFVYDPEPLEKTIEYAKTFTKGPIVLADHGDNAGAGGSHDNMDVLAEIFRQGLDNVAVAPIADPEASDLCWQAGEGAQLTLAVGGKIASPSIGLPAKPLLLTGTVKRLMSIKFAITSKMLTGFEVDLGRSAVFEVAGVEMIICEHRTEPADLGFFTHAGIDPLSKRYLLLKSRQHFRVGFESIASEILLVAGPGVCSSDYSVFEFKHLSRPIYPLDETMDWSPPTL